MFNEPVTWTAPTLSLSRSLSLPLPLSLFLSPLRLAEAKDQKALVSSAGFFLRQLYRGTSPINKRPSLGPYSRIMPRLLWQSQGAGAIFFERGIPVSRTLFDPIRRELQESSLPGKKRTLPLPSHLGTQSTVRTYIPHGHTRAQ